MKKVKVILGADHAGYTLKEKVRKYLRQEGIAYEDVSPVLREGDDYPDVAFAVAERVARDENNRGVLVCGTGSGMAIAANKVPNIRAVEAYDDYTAKMSREHNDANILALRARKFPVTKALGVLKTWLAAKFSGEERHMRRLRKINDYE